MCGPTTPTYRPGTKGGQDAEGASFPLEIAAVWALFGVVAIEIVVTYSRLPASDLYHVSGTGPAGGFGRALVFANWPTALVAIPVIVLLYRHISGRAARGLAFAGLVLSAAVFWPGIVRDSDLDARAVNAIAALGVLIALALSVLVCRELGKPRAFGGPDDGLRLLVAAALIAVAIPWIAADLGFSLNGIPVLGSIYQTGELRTQPGVAGLHPAVHHGHHHGMDGVLLVLSTLLLSRRLASVRGRLLRGLLGAYLALLASYGAGNVANDFWIEQVVKRGWTNWEIPDVTTPKLSIAWGVIVIGAAVLWALAAGLGRRALIVEDG